MLPLQDSLSRKHIIPGFYSRKYKHIQIQWEDNPKKRDRRTKSEIYGLETEKQVTTKQYHHFHDNEIPLQVSGKYKEWSEVIVWASAVSLCRGKSLSFHEHF